MTDVNKIPKIIHCCWFGKSQKPQDVVNCIDSWKRYLPDYEIIEWNEENFDIENSVDYVKEAYSCKKWAFVSDYVRLYALSEYGGIYFDTDVEVFKSFDNLLNNDCFFGFESKDYLMTAVMASIKEFHIIKEFMKEYDARHFIVDGASVLSESTNVVALTKLMKKKGLKLNGQEQVVESAKIYPQKYFSENSFRNIFNKYSRHAFAYHYYYASWMDKNIQNNLRARTRHYLLCTARNILGTPTVYRLGRKKDKLRW